MAKIKYLIICIVFPLLSLAIIPLNLFKLNIPEWFVIMLSLVIIAVNILMWISRHIKLLSSIIISLWGVFAITAIVFCSYCNPYWNSISFMNDADYYANENTLTYGQAKSDMDYALKYLKKLHPSFFNNLPYDIESEYNTALERLRNLESIDATDVAQGVESFLSPLHDAHTYAAARYQNPHYMKYIYAHNKAGDTLIGINDFTIDEFLDNCSDKLSFETKTWGINCILNHVSTLEGLDYLGIPIYSGMRVKYTYQTKNGTVSEQYAEKEDFLTLDKYRSYNNIKDNPLEQYHFVSYEIDVDRSLAVLTLTECNNNSEYKQCLRSMFTKVRDNGIQNVAVDLRNNGGGNSGVANEFFRYLNVDSYKEWADDWRLGWFMIRNEQSVIQNKKYDDLLFDGNLYILTSDVSFSSAMNFAEYVKDNNIGTIIGESPGNAPDSYGDISTFKLPESGVIMQVSTKKWYRIDNLPGLIEPDIYCPADEAVDYLYQQCGN